MLNLTVKDFFQPRYCELQRLLDPGVTRLGYGELRMEFVRLNTLNFDKVRPMKSILQSVKGGDVPI